MRRISTGTLFRQLLLAVYLLFTLYPLVWLTLTAFRHEGDAQQRPLALPAEWTWQNLQLVWQSGNFGQAYLNSLLLCTLAVAVALALASLAAFAFANFHFRGKTILYVLFLLGMMIPVHVTLIPLNSLLGSGGLNIKGSLYCLLGPYAGFALPISILIMRRAFEAVPQEMLDAGQMDGCTAWQTFWHIALPLVRPALSTVLIFNFLTMWNEYAFALTLLGPGCQTIPLAITEFKGEHDVQITQICAALLLIVIPLLVIYACAQKHIVNGLTAGAIKE